MSLRELISYNKDYLTGEIFTEKKNKEYTGIKGKVLIEIFDANTNAKIKEAYTENVIPDIIFKDIFLRYFSGDVLGIGSTGHSNTTDLFSNIYLTDSTKPESANSERVSGNIIGYAHRGTTYSGNETQRGTINLAETNMEIRNGKVRVNFVFDFPTHAANGTFESIYWSDSFSNLDTAYIGPPVCGRTKTSGTGYLYIASSTVNEELRAAYWGISYLMNGSSPAKFTAFIDYHKGFVYFDGNNSAVNSSYIQFPESLKGHQLILPFDLNLLSAGFVDWAKAITLLNDSGEPFSSSLISGATPVLDENGDIDYIVGYYRSSNKLSIYQWSKVGVLQSTSTIDNMSTEFRDEYGTNFNYCGIALTPVTWRGPIELFGYNSRLDQQTNETIYSNRLIRLNLDGTKHNELNLKPKIGSSTWFASRGMDSGNIERRCYLSSVSGRSKNRLYLYYSGTNGGSSFYQVVTPEGNLLEPYRSSGVSSGLRNIRGTDRWLYMYRSSSNGTYSFGIHYGATSKPCGAHTKLANPVQKTDANTMKIQYMFEIDLINYAEDYY